MTKTYTYRLKGLSERKHKSLEALFNHLTWLYNEGIAYCRTTYKETRKGVSSEYSLYNWLTGKRGEDIHTKQWGSWTQRSVLKRISLAYVAFFKKQRGYPRFKSFNRGVRSFEPQNKLKRKGNKYYISVKNIGKLYFDDTRNILSQDGIKVKQTQIVKTAKRYNVQIVCELPDVQPAEFKDVVGIDLGVKHPATLSNGKQYEPFKPNETRKKRLQRKLARAQKGSNNRKKVKASLAKECQKLSEQRRGHTHELTTDIIKNHSVHLGIEDLKVQNLTRKGGNRKKGLNRAILNQAPSTIIAMLSYKAESAGGKVYKVAPHYTSQECSGCGHIQKMDLDVRTYDCPECGLSLDRDVNAAKNIRQRALSAFNREESLYPNSQAKPDLSGIKSIRLLDSLLEGSGTMANNSVHKIGA